MTQIDVRAVEPRDRHPMIFDTFDGMPPGASFELINDHDPKPLYYQLMYERTGEFEWDYVESGPMTWRVRITRTRAASA